MKYCRIADNTFLQLVEDLARADFEGELRFGLFLAHGAGIRLAEPNKKDRKRSVK